MVPQLYKLWSVVSNSDEAASGQRCLQFVFECVSKERLVAVIIAGLNYGKPNVQQAVLQGLVEAVDRLGDEMADPLAMSDSVMALLIKLMDAAAGKVRDAVPPVVRVLARGRHQDMLSYVTATGLRREQKALLAKAIEQAESEGESVGGRRSAEFEAALAVDALGEQASAPSGNGGANANMATTSGFGSGGNIGNTNGNPLASSSGGLSRSVSSSTLATSNATPVHIDTEDQLKRELTKLRDQLAKTDKNEWQSLVSQLKLLQGVILGGAATIKSFLETFATLLTPKLKEIMKIDRAQVVEELNRTLCVLAVTMGHSSAPFFKGMMASLIEKIDAGANIVTGHYDTCISTAIALTSPDIGKRLVDFLMAKEKNATGRGRVVLYMQQIIVNGTADYADPYAAIFADGLKKALSDADSKNRTYARQTYAEYFKRWPERGLALYNSLEASIQSVLLQNGIDPSKMVAAGTVSASTMHHPTPHTHTSAGTHANAHTPPAPFTPSVTPPLSGFETNSTNNLQLLAGDRTQGQGSKLHASTGEIQVGPHSSPVHLVELAHSGGVPVPASSSSGNLARGKDGKSVAASKSKEISKTVSTAATTTSAALRIKAAKATSATATTGKAAATRLQHAASAALPSSSGHSTSTGTAKSAQRVVNNKSTSSDPAQTPRKIASVATLTGKQPAVVPPSSITKAKSANTITLNSGDLLLGNGASSNSTPASPSKKSSDAGSVASDSTAATLEMAEEEIPSSPRAGYSAASSDTTEFRSILKRCAASDIDIEERTRSMEALRQLMRNDSLPGLWSNATLLPQFAKALASRLLDSQARVLQATLEILELVATEHAAVFDSIFETLSQPLFLAAYAASSRDEHRSSAQSLLLAEVSNNPSAFVPLALKAIAIPDTKLRLATVRSLVLCIDYCGSFFERQPKRTELFIQQLAVKPNNVNSSIDMTKAVYELFGKLYLMLGEAFAVPLRLAKFTGLDTLMKKHKIPVKPGSGATSSAGSIPVKPVGLAKKTSVPTMNAASTQGNAAKLRQTISASHVAEPSVGVPVVHNVSGRARPVLVKQKSLGALPTGRVLLAPAASTANGGSSLDSEFNDVAMDPVDASVVNLISMVDTSILPPSTPSADRVRQMRMEIAQTPNVLITVMNHSDIISPLASTVRHGTPTMQALGRSTSTPQLRSVKASGRVVDDENSGANSMDLFSPVKFKLDFDDGDAEVDQAKKDKIAIAKRLQNGELTKLVGLLESDLDCLTMDSASEVSASTTMTTTTKTADWGAVETHLESIDKLLASKSLNPESILYTLKNDALLEHLKRCMDRGVTVIKVRQRACKVFATIRAVLPAADWEDIFTTLPPPLQSLLKSFMSARETAPAPKKAVAAH